MLGLSSRSLRRRGADDLRVAGSATPAARSTSSTRPRLRHDADVETLRRVVARPAARSSARPATSRPPTGGLYAIRDATGTVESIPLIVASILSKKLAAGLDALVMDVKFGWAPSWPPARTPTSWRALVEVAGGATSPTVALLTDMDQVLGSTAGNAVEVRESVEYLTGAAREPPARGHARARRLAARPGRAVRGRGRRARRGRGVTGVRRRRRALRPHGRRARRPRRFLERPVEHLAAAPCRPRGRARARRRS